MIVVCFINVSKIFDEEIEKHVCGSKILVKEFLAPISSVSEDDWYTLVYILPQRLLPGVKMYEIFNILQFEQNFFIIQKGLKLQYHLNFFE